jgi:hypothetical protein
MLCIALMRHCTLVAFRELERPKNKNPCAAIHVAAKPTSVAANLHLS